MNRFILLLRLFVAIAISSGIVLVLDRQRKVVIITHRNIKSIRRGTGTAIKHNNKDSYHNTYYNQNNKSSIIFHQSLSSEQKKDDWPALNSLIGDRVRNVTGNVQSMLDFAIIGHPKTATTFLMKWLGSHDEIQMYRHEVNSLEHGKPAELVSLLYQMKPGWQYKRGYKAPRDLISIKALISFATYFPKTKLIIGLRHPVLWFESFYNFRVRHGYTMPPPETLLGRCRGSMYGVCTDESKFHFHLNNLGKINNSTLQEEKYLSWGNNNGRRKIPKIRNPVFLYEMNQLNDKNNTRSDLFRSDLKIFLDLKNDLNQISKSSKRSNKEKAISICDEKYSHIRTELMKNAIEASIWIREYFLQSPDVVVSSSEYFVELLKLWLIDPCTMRIDERLRQ